MKGTSISFLARRARVSLALLAATSLILLVAAAPVAAKPGYWTVRPGYTVTMSNMNVNACNSLEAFYGITTTTPETFYALGGNSGNECSDWALPDLQYTNDSGSSQTLTFVLYDYSCGVFFDSYGDTWGNHAVARHGGVSISDAGGACELAAADAKPKLGAGNFNATLTFTRP
jgi:hypothetical protein